MNKSDRIRKLLSQGVAVKEIAKRVGVKPSFVYVIRWQDKNKNKKKPKAKKGKAQEVKKVKVTKDSNSTLWLKNNPWFGVDEGKTAYALGLHEKLIQSGVDAKSNAYWTRVDEGMKAFDEFKQTKNAERSVFTPDSVVDKGFVEVTYPLPDPVNHPPHYKSGGIETIDFIEAKDLNYRLGNVIKYVSRAGKKEGVDPIEDLEKAVWYLQREIAARRKA